MSGGFERAGETMYLPRKYCSAALLRPGSSMSRDCSTTLINASKRTKVPSPSASGQQIGFWEESRRTEAPWSADS